MANKKQRKKTTFLIIIWIVVLAFVPFITKHFESSMRSQSQSYISSDLDIKDYEINLNVNKNNKVDVIEKIKINIPEESYNGIYKSIPIWQEYYDENNKLQKKKINITNLRVTGEKFVKKEHTNNIELRIGSTRVKARPGLHEYTIKYRYDMGKDYNKDNDYFAFNIFDSYDDTKINKLKINLTMPKKIEDNSLSFTIDKNKKLDKLNYKIDGNKLEATLDNYTLDKTLSLKMLLPNNYFVETRNNYGNISLTISVIIILLTIFFYFKWKKYGKDINKSVKTIEFYPPNGLDPAEIAYIYGERDIKKITTAIIISLANKKFITIKDENELIKETNSKETPTIIEKLVYDELFKNSDRVLLKQANFDNIYRKITTSLVKLTDEKINDKESNKITKNVFASLVICILIWMFSYIYIKDLNPNFEILYLISFISIFIIGIFSIIMDRKTSYGEIVYAKILGFKEYLETAEKDKINALVEENPNYYYDILPYAYVLGVTSKWIKEFEQKNLPSISLPGSVEVDETLFKVI